MDTYYIFAGRGAGSVFLAEHDLVAEHTAARWLAKRCVVATVMNAGHGMTPHSLLAIAVVGSPSRSGRTPGATNLRKNEVIADDSRLHSPSRAGASCIDAPLHP